MPTPVTTTKSLTELGTANPDFIAYTSNLAVQTNSFTLIDNIIIDDGETLFINAEFTIAEGVYIYNKGTFFITNPIIVNNGGVFVNEGLLKGSNREEKFYTKSGGYFFNLNENQIGGGSSGDNTYLYKFVPELGSTCVDVKSTLNLARYNYNYGEYIPNYTGDVPPKTPTTPTSSL